MILKNQKVKLNRNIIKIDLLKKVLKCKYSTNKDIMKNEEEILKIKNIAIRKIKELKYTISKMELESYNLDLKNNKTEAKYNIAKSRNVDLTKQVFDFAILYL